ncbi:unnamed protein product [Adineta steineri]|uniref:Uncharacterized protein n=1 Tax=Adineta steineri TaxID=433720 RepID=A0A815TVD2_9BILA|nr:unnamed protein product [Adineta steineri]
MEDFYPDPVSIYSFSNFKLDPPFTLPLIDFALAIDEVLPPQLPNRLDHLVKIIKQSFDVDIQSHQIYDMLLIFKQESKNGKDLLHHNKNIEEELKKYSTNTSNICEYSTSTPFCLPFTILPKSNKCPQCDTDLSSTAKYRIVTLYLANGTSTTATVINYSCQARNCSLEVFPNFITNLCDGASYSFTTPEIFSNEKFIYLGGQTAFESLILKQYSCLLSNGHVAFDSFTRAYNQLGEGERVFVQFWSSHCSFHPCQLKSEGNNNNNLCSAAIICDGHMKIRRRLCANANVSLTLPEHFSPVFNNLMLGCNVSKEEILIDGSIRACGILVMATNCQVIVAFEEILKSESKKQVTQALANMYTLAPFLPKLVIYDAECLLAKFILNNFKDESKSNESVNNNNNNTGLNILKTARFFIDRFHLTNHKDVRDYVF